MASRVNVNASPHGSENLHDRFVLVVARHCLVIELESAINKPDIDFTTLLWRVVIGHERTALLKLVLDSLKVLRLSSTLSDSVMLASNEAPCFVEVFKFFHFVFLIIFNH